MNKILITLVTISILVLHVEVSFAQNTTINSFVNSNRDLSFNSSDKELNEVFSWAKKQALSYAFEGDAVGLWYEAGLPGREVFCMRDVSHQAMGAHYLGLAAYTKNMLYKFAENISDSRDWCSFWEITRHGTPAIQDYLNDNEFWYNLPGNFDVLDCCFRMYNLTGDMDYLSDPVFLNFYDKTVSDYIERWDIGIDKVMTRDCYLNNDAENNRRFSSSRGFPGYDEGRRGYSASLDLLVTQQGAFEAYAKIQLLKGNMEVASSYFAKADEVVNFINTQWWNETNQRYYSLLDKDTLRLGGGGNSVLYFGALNDTLRLRATLDGLLEKLPKKTHSGIEGLSHLPEILYRWEEQEDARTMLLFVSESDRREYPEASFGTIGAMVSGLMGVEMDDFPKRRALKAGYYGEQFLVTRSRLTEQTKWAEMKHIPIKRNDISVRHEGTTKTTFTNHSGPQLLWKASFSGSIPKLKINGKLVESKTETLPINGEQITSAIVIVGPGETMTVELVK